jgi:hypothetical protein
MHFIILDVAMDGCGGSGGQLCYSYVAIIYSSKFNTVLAYGSVWLEVVGCKGVGEPGFARHWEAAAAARVRDEPGCRAAEQRVVWQA